MSIIAKVTRREFMKKSALLGGGLVLACHVPLAGKLAIAGTDATFAPNAFLRIGADESVTIIVNKSEMGQGVYTSLPMLLAEELECDWRRIKVEPSPVSNEYNHTQFGPVMVTGGSTSVRSEWERFSRAGAAAREMLIAAAAESWGIDPSACRAENGYVTGPEGRKESFGKLASMAARLPVPENPPLKGGKKRRLLGKPVHRLDSPAKIDGKAIFGIDVYEPGMLTAVIERPPLFGAKVKSFDSVKTEALPGVRAVVSVQAGVAVLADSFWQAEKGRRALSITWDMRDGEKTSTEKLRGEYAELAGMPGIAARHDGDAPTALTMSDHRIEADYSVPYLAHATMEPLNCFVDLGKDRCLIKTGSQFQTLDRLAAAKELGMEPEQIIMETAFLGGGFGRRACTGHDFVLEAVQVAKAAGKPVKVVRTREDDIRSGYYRPMYCDHVSAALDKNGRPSAWRQTIAGQSIMTGTSMEKAMVREGIDHTSVEGAIDLPYNIPNVLVDLHTTKNNVPVLWWRSVGHSHTAFVVESFMDELAHISGNDPYEYRLSLLANRPRHSEVLKIAAARSGWGKPMPKGRGRGIALHESFGSFVAQVAEVSVDSGGNMKVDRMVAVIDCGKIVNPDTIAAQIESGIIFGLSAALHGEITLVDGRVQEGNFDTYPIVRMDESPVIEVHIAKSDAPPGGVGEPGVPPAAPAVANALFAATGARVRSLPITAEKIRRSISDRNSRA